jgi:hypothetical protein
MDPIRVLLERAPDDPPEDDPQFQAELKEFYRQAWLGRVILSQTPFAQFRGGEYWRPDFLALVPAAIGAIAALCGAWVQARYGRKVRLKIGDTEAEGRSVEEIETLLQKAKQFKAAAEQNKELEP